jgi:hypothetical protein
MVGTAQAAQMNLVLNEKGCGTDHLRLFPVLTRICSASVFNSTLNWMLAGVSLDSNMIFGARDLWR